LTSAIGSLYDHGSTEMMTVPIGLQ